MKEFSTKEDIIKEVSENLNINEEKVRYVFDFLVDYIKKLTSLRNIFTINFPFLGRMYVKVRKLRRNIIVLENQSKKEELSRLKKIKLSKCKEKLEKIAQNSQKGTSKLKLHWKRNKLNSRFYTNGKTLEELENFQNEEER